MPRCGNAAAERRRSGDVSVPNLLLDVVGEAIDPAGAPDDSRRREMVHPVRDVDRAGSGGSERAEGGDVRAIEADRIVEIVETAPRVARVARRAAGRKAE